MQWRGVPNSWTWCAPSVLSSYSLGTPRALPLMRPCSLSRIKIVTTNIQAPKLALLSPASVTFTIFSFKIGLSHNNINMMLGTTPATQIQRTHSSFRSVWANCSACRDLTIPHHLISMNLQPCQYASQPLL